MMKKVFLSDDNIAQMLLRFQRGMTAREVALEFGCTETTAYKVKNGKGRFAGHKPAKRRKKTPVVRV